MASRPSTEPHLRVAELAIARYRGGHLEPDTDALALEEPLEIRLAHHAAGVRHERSLAITMRTPGHDVELAAGFLLSEGLLGARSELAEIRPCGPTDNVIKAELALGVAVDLKRLERHFYTSSSCGVCGKSSLEALSVSAKPLVSAERPRLSAEMLCVLPDRLREAQTTFDRTGGLHAAGLFDPSGTLLLAREDVGRHNAVDKLIGAMFLSGATPLSASVLCVSGRASFELVQKALVAGIPAMVAVGAPSSLAVELAREAGMTLLGFVRDGRFNVYSGARRVETLQEISP